MAEQNKKKVAVVTGASRGIGRAIALELASRGAAVVINYNGSEERAKEVQKEIEEKGGEAEIRQWNVADFAACERAVKDIVKTHGSIDILVNNAGITKDGLLMGMSEADFDSVIDVNLKGTFNMMRFVSRAVLSEEVKKASAAQIPLGYFGKPEDIAKTVAFLASDDAAYITGQVIQVDGGMVI